MPVQLPVKIGPVSLPQGKPHAEADDAFHPSLGAASEESHQIFLGIVEKRQDGTQPNHRRNPPLPASLQDLNPAGGGAHMGFQNPTQGLVIEMCIRDRLVYYKIFFQFYSATSMGNAGQVVQFWKVALAAIGKNLVLLLLLAVPLVVAAVWGGRILGSRGKMRRNASVLLAGVTAVSYTHLQGRAPAWTACLMRR